MNKFIVLILALLPLGAQCEEYLLSFSRNCSTMGQELKYKCEKSEDNKHYVYKDNNGWKVRSFTNTYQVPLRLLNEDENILVLEQDTVYSGNQVIYIMKKNNQFYLIQVAYSNILEKGESTTKQGIYIKTEG